MRGTRMRPRSSSTRTSQNTAPKERVANFSFSSPSSTCAMASTVSFGAAVLFFSRAFSHAAFTAGATLATVVEPPETPAGGISVSPSSKSILSTGMPSASAATCVMTV